MRFIVGQSFSHLEVLMSATPEQKEEIRQLFRKNVPAVADGNVEIVCIARDVGLRSYAAVRSHNSLLDPVGTCTGIRGAHLKAMASELKGEHFTIVRWDESPDRFIQNAFGPQAKVTLYPTTREALVITDRTPIRDLDLPLVAELTGWKLSLRSKEQENGTS